MSTLPIFGVADDLSPEFERAIHPVAERARAGDRAAIEAVFMSFEPKIARFVRGVRVSSAPGGGSGSWDRDDVYQEAYLVFRGLVHRWDPAIPFGRYFLANFPWRLRDAVSRGVARRGVPPRSTVVTLDAPGLADRLADDAAREAEAHVLIEAVASTFEPPLSDVLRLHILEGLSLTATAERLGVSRRSANRYWRTIRQAQEQQA